MTAGDDKIKSAMLRVVLKVVGLAAVVVGAVTAPLPLPIGLPLIAVGLAILITTSKTAVRVVRFVRARYPWLDEKLMPLQDRLPATLARAMKRTHAERHHRVQQRARRRRRDAA